MPLTLLQNVFRAVMTNPYSVFYRKRFADLRLGDDFPENLTAWQALPLLSRKEIVATPFWERVFVPPAKLPFIRNTSGTSGEGVFIVPRNTFGDYASPYSHISFQRMVSTMPSFYYDFPRLQTGAGLMSGDLANPALTARLIELFDSDALWCRPDTAMLLASRLTEKRRRAMRVIHLIGERCSPLNHEALQKNYPSALIFSTYGISEGREFFTAPCPVILAEKKLWSHPVTECFYFELIDPETGAVMNKGGKAGELVITTLVSETPFPLIRYRTGDLVRIVRTDCSCGLNSPVYDFLGRVSSDMIKILGGELTLEEVERVMYVFRDFVGDDFEVHCLDEPEGDAVKPRVIFKVTPRRTDFDFDKLATEIAKELKLSPGSTYQQEVEWGFCLPLRAERLEKAAPRLTGGKRKRIIRITS